MRRVLLVTLLLTTTAVLFAVNRSEFVLHRFRSDSRQSALEDVLYLVGGLELVEIGLSSARVLDTPDYILETEYSTADGVIAVWYTLSRADKSDVVIATRQFRVSIDENPEYPIARAVRDLVARAGIDVTPSSDARIDGVIPDFGRNSSTTDFRRDEQQRGMIAPVPERAVVARDARRFCLSTAFGGVFWIGDIAPLFRYGPNVSVFVGTEVPRRTFNTAFGGKLAVFRFVPEDGVAGGDLYITTLGPDARITTSGDQVSTVGVHGSAGLAVITIFGAEGTLAKSVPYLDLGATGRVAVSRVLSIGFELKFVTIFDPNSTIMGVPAAMSFTLGL